MWEDEANRRGGKLSIKLRKGMANQLWEETLLALVGEQFDEACECIPHARLACAVLARLACQVSGCR